MPLVPRQINTSRLSPRGDSPLLALRVLFWVTALSALGARSITAHLEGQFVPNAWVHQEWVFFTLLSLYLPVIALWPSLPWKPCAPRREKTISAVFLASSIALFSVLDFGHYLLILVAVTHAVCVHRLGGGLLTCSGFALVNTMMGMTHHQVPDTLALVNGGILFAYCLVVLIASASLIAAGEHAQRTQALLRELEDAHRKLRHYAARTRELAIDEERTRLSREMHDSTGHYLTGINLCLANAQRSTHDTSADLKEDIDNARHLAKEALAETRRWVRALKPLRLENLDGPGALHDLTTAFGDLGITTTFELIGDWPDGIDGEVELALYRTVQEGLTNALRHSQASRVDVRARFDAGVAIVDVVDDGVGAIEGAEGSGFGLSSLKERLTSLDGSLCASALPEGGFCLKAHVPWRSSYSTQEAL